MTLPISDPGFLQSTMPSITPESSGAPDASPGIDSASSTSAASAASRTSGASALQTPAEALDPAHEEPAADAPVRELLPNANKHLDRLLERAALETPGLTKSLAAEVARNVPKPGIFRAGRKFHPAVTAAAAKCEAAAAEMARLPARAFMEKPLSDESFAVLKRYTDAHNELAGSLAEFANAAGTTPEISDLIEASSFRAAEAMNLAARLMTADPEGVAGDEQNNALAQSLLDKTAAEGLRTLSPEMHGGQVAERLEGRISALSAEMDALEAANLPIPEFKAAAARLQEKAMALYSDVATPDPQTGLQCDHSLRDAAKGVLERAVGRLGAMAAHDPIEEASAKLKSIVPDIDDKTIADLGRSAPRGIRDNFRIVREGAAACRATGAQLQEDLRTKVATGRMAAADLAEGAKRAAAQLRSPDAESSVKLMILLGKAADGKHFPRNAEGLEDFHRALGRTLGRPVSRNEAATVFGWAYENFAEGMPGEKLSGQLGASLANTMVRTTTGRRELADLTAMLEMRTTAEISGSKVAEAFETSVSMETLVNAALLDIPADQIETRASDDVLKSAKVLGHGAANEVHLCTYRGPDGEDLKLVFKPEDAARRGLDTLAAGNLGYRAAARTMQLNVAASQSADMIGCGDVVARSKIGTHDGQFGLFMEAAPGKTAAALRRSRAFKADLASFAERGMTEMVRGNFMRELNRLEWADILSGQADRHYENYLVDVDRTTGAVKVTGIDNDASFGTRKVGVTQVDVGAYGVGSRVEELSVTHLRERLRAGDSFRGGLADASKMTDDEIAALRSVFGFNQMTIPTHIDRDVYEKLMAINPNAYMREMRKYMPGDAAYAATLRLRDAQSQARELAARGRVVEGDAWQSQEVFDQVRGEHHAMKDELDRSDLSVMLYSGFFARDFLDKFEAAS